MRVAILILAAGSSSRMGKTKQLLPLEETTLLGKAIEHALASNADSICCVLGAQADQVLQSIKKYDVETIINSNFKNGLSSSIVAGLKALLDFDAILITLADQPKVDSRYLNALISEFRNHSDYVIASDYKGIKGVPALFPREYYSKLLKLHGDKGAKQLLNSEGISVKTINSSVNLLDIDTPEDFKKLIQALNSDSI